MLCAVCIIAAAAWAFAPWPAAAQEADVTADAAAAAGP